LRKSVMMIWQQMTLNCLVTETSFWFWLRESGLLLVEIWWVISHTDQASISSSTSVTPYLCELEFLALFSS
jgi:hypothetical protein